MNVHETDSGQQKINPFVEQLAEKTSWECNEVNCGQFDSSQCQLWGKALAGNNTIKELSIHNGKLLYDLRKALHHNRTIQTLSFAPNTIDGDVAAALAVALKVNSTITRIDISHNYIGDYGVEELGAALKVNKTVTSIDFKDTFIGDDGAEALADALQVNRTIARINMSHNRIGVNGAVTLARALRVNSTVTSIDLDSNGICDEGAMALAKALQLNRTVTTINLRYCKVGDVGLLLLCEAAERNTIITELGVGNNDFTLKETERALSKLSFRVWYTVPRNELQDSPSLMLKELLFSSEKSLNAGMLAAAFWFRSEKIPGFRKYGAVLAVCMDNVPLALGRMRLDRDNLAEVISESQGSSILPWRSSGVIAELLASSDPPNGATAARAASAVIAAVQGRGALSVVNVHICGDCYAGKTTTSEAIVKGINHSTSLFLSLPMPSNGLEEGRTLGMVSTVMDYRGLDGSPVRALLHDYGGQESFRANHAAHLAAPNSVYLLVLPMWDMRPQPVPNEDKPLNKPMELDELVTTYTNWLKFINTVVEEKGARCITALNFAKQFQAVPRRYTVQNAITALAAVQALFSANELCKLSFVGEPILVNSSIPASVHKRLIPLLKPVLAALEAAPVPVAPALQAVLADMAVPGKWPLFAYERQLKALIHGAIAAKYSPAAWDFPAKSVRDSIVNTIAHITQDQLESRRDIVVFPVHSGERVAIIFPNWLTEKLLGSLFDPRRRARASESAAVTATSDASDPTHLLSAQDIDEAVKANLDANTRAMLDAQFIPKLLQHVGVCIPVLLGANGLARGVAEGDDLSRVTHWFPAFSTIPMKETDGAPLKDCDHIVARQFKLVNPDFCVFPPGYFSSLFVGIVGLYDQAHLVQLYQDGMELCSGSETFKVVVRRRADPLSFEVKVATRGTPAGSSLAFDAMQAITQLIFGPGSWRRNVQVQECGLHPTQPKAAGIPVENLLPRLKDPALCEISLPFYFGMERQGADRMVALKLEAVLAKLDAADRKADDRHVEVMSRLDSINEQVQAQHDATERMEDALAEASATLVDTSEQLRGMCDSLLQAIPVTGRGELDVAEESAQQARGLVQEHRDMLDRAALLTAAQLQQMKSEIVEDLGKVAAEMQRSTLAKLQEWEEAQSVAAAERLQNLLSGHYKATADALQEVQTQLTTEIGELRAQQAGAAGSVAEALQEGILRLQNSIAAVQIAQRNDVYGVYELPLLAEIKSQESRGTAKDVALRWIYDVYRLHFLCPVCGVPAASGPKQKGYKLLVTKGWVAKVSKVLKASLLALQVVSLVTPLPLPRVAELARYLPTEELKAVANAVGFGVKKVNEQANASAGGVKAVQDATPQPPEITLEHVASIRELLLLAGESSPPKLTGLSPAICAATQQCAWVCAGACRDKYMAQGDACLAIKMKLA